MKPGDRVKAFSGIGRDKIEVLACGVIVKIEGHKVYIRCMNHKGVEIVPWYPINFVELRD